MVGKLSQALLRSLKTPLVFQILLLAYSALLVMVSIFPAGLASTHFSVALTDTPEHLSSVFGYSDAGSYLKASLELNSLNMLTPNQYWVINLWPPGMVVLNALLIHLFGSGYAAAYAILIALIWTILGWVFALEVSKHFGAIVAYLSLSFLLLSSPLQSWIFNSGLFYAEGVSVAAFIFGLIFLVKGFGNQQEIVRVAYAIASGTFIAISAYFRSTFSTLEAGLLIVVVALVFQVFLLKRFRSHAENKKTKWGQIRFFGVAWFSTFTLMEPWLQFTQHLIRPGIRAWSVVGSGFFRNVWVDRSNAADFMQAGGVGWGCEINPEVCHTIINYESQTGKPYPINEIVLQTIWTIITHPFEYLSDRLHFISIGWFSNEVSMGAMSIASGTALLIIFLYLVSRLIRDSREGKVPALYVLIACLLLFAPEMVGHVEPRYFIPLKILFVIFPWLLSSNKKSELAV